MIKGIIFAVCTSPFLVASLLLAPLLLACEGKQLLPGESTASPGRPDFSEKGLVNIDTAPHRKDKQKQHQGGGRATKPGDSIGGSNADQRDGAIRLDVNVQVSDSGQLGDGSSTKPKKTTRDEDRRAGRAAAILGSGAGSEGIRDKLGRSGRRGPGKTLG